MPNQRTIDIRICKMMNWSYSRGWAFEKTGDKLNVTGQMQKVREQIKAKLCMKCEHPIGDHAWREVTTLARFGQMLFEHLQCPEVVS